MSDEPKQTTITNSVIESSPFNLLSFGGYADQLPSIAYPQTLLVFNVTMRSFDVLSSASLIEIRDFEAAPHHVFTLSLVTFNAVSFAVGGSFINFGHHATPLSPSVIANCFFIDNRNGHISVKNSDTS